MVLTRKQEEGLRLAVEKYRNGKKCIIISGYAGTGKSTLVKFIIEALADYNIDPEEDVCFSTFTGKAAQVLLKKGNKNVSTLHKLLYESIPKPDGTFFRKKKPVLEYKVIVVDEISMAPKEMIDLLFTHNVFVIGLGDPFQLPPIDKDQDNGLLHNPDIFLDEIMRQALDSEIIRLSMAIRHQEPILYKNGSEVIILPKDKLNTGMLSWANQILVGTNATRIAINNQMRVLMGRGDKPEPGDKLICLRNYWEQLATNDDPLVNGTIGYIDNIYETYHKIPAWAGNATIAVTVAGFTSDSDADFGELKMDTQQILTGERCLDRKTIYKLSKNWKTVGLIPMEFTYAYAITCHKSQGSSWPNVLVLEESFPFNKEEHARWLYTACTRAEERLVLVR